MRRRQQKRTTAKICWREWARFLLCISLVCWKSHTFLILTRDHVTGGLFSPFTQRGS